MSEPSRPAGPVEWITLALICGCAVLCGLLELMSVPLYVGSVILPVAVVAALVSNVMLPWWGLRVIGSGMGAVVPVLCWLIAVLALSLVSRPEGDLFVTATHGQQYNFYAMLLVGAAAGFGVIAKLAPVRARAPRPPAARPRPSGRPGGGAKNRRVSR